MVRIRSAEPLDAFKVRLEFTDGTQREVNLEPYLHGPIFEPIRNDRRLFCAMRIQDGTITWANGADIDPDVLHQNLTPAWMEVESIPHRV